jgi:hypothetical protein
VITAVVIMMSMVLMPCVRAARGIVVVRSVMLTCVTLVADVLRRVRAIRALHVHRVGFTVVVILGVGRNPALFAFLLHVRSFFARRSNRRSLGFVPRYGVVCFADERLIDRQLTVRA